MSDYYPPDQDPRRNRPDRRSLDDDYQVPDLRRNLRAQPPTQGDDPYYDEQPELGGRRAPDLRQRSEAYQRARSQRQRVAEVDDELRPPQASSRRSLLGSLSTMDMVFLVALLLAAMRGGFRRDGNRSQRGCMPSRGCINTLGLNLGGIFLIIGSIYLYGEKSISGDVATGLGGLGTVSCCIGMSGVIMLLSIAVRMIDFGSIGEGSLDDATGGLLDNIMRR